MLDTILDILSLLLLLPSGKEERRDTRYPLKYTLLNYALLAVAVALLFVVFISLVDSPHANWVSLLMVGFFVPLLALAAILRYRNHRKANLPEQSQSSRTDSSSPDGSG
jgi:hypothetical protein